jgi:LysM repeat protein
MQKFKEEKEKKRLEALAITEEEKKKKLEKEETRLETLRLAEEEKKKALEEKRKNQGLYVIEKGDSLSTIAAKFNIKTNALRTLNNLEKKSAIRIGKKLTIPYNQKRVDAIARAEYVVEKGDSLGSIAQDFNLTSKAILKHNRLKRGAKILTRYGMKNGTKVRIAGLSGIYRVRDKMNKRYRKRIDIYMGVNRRKALRWGRRSVVIYW